MFVVSLIGIFQTCTKRNFGKGYAETVKFYRGFADEMKLSKVTASRRAKQMIKAGCSFRNLTDKPYPPELQAAVSAGSLKPDDCTVQNPSHAAASGDVISTANNLATWIEALVGRQTAQRRLSAPVARYRAARGGEQARRPKVRVRHQPI